MIDFGVELKDTKSISGHFALSSHLWNSKNGHFYSLSTSQICGVFSTRSLLKIRVLLLTHWVTAIHIVSRNVFLQHANEETFWRGSNMLSQKCCLDAQTVERFRETFLPQKCFLVFGSFFVTLPFQRGDWQILPGGTAQREGLRVEMGFLTPPLLGRKK